MIDRDTGERRDRRIATIAAMLSFVAVTAACSGPTRSIEDSQISGCEVDRGPAEDYPLLRASSEASEVVSLDETVDKFNQDAQTLYDNTVGFTSVELGMTDTIDVQIDKGSMIVAIPDLPVGKPNKLEFPVKEGQVTQASPGVLVCTAQDGVLRETVVVPALGEYAQRSEQLTVSP